MGRTASRADLLHICIVDLRAGKVLLADRLPPLADAARDARLQAVLRAEIDRAKDAIARLDAVGKFANGPANLWMAGILDDADRDSGSHQPGVLLDIALIGAVRKAKAAEIVSWETALALAQAIDEAFTGVLQDYRATDIATDHSLRLLLNDLTPG